jgi:5'-nucleotidase
VNILLSNDDGYKSLGLKALQAVLKEYGNVLTVAPNKDISASSSSLSVHNQVRVDKISNNYYKVYGTPADCVHIATRGMLRVYPDIVFSGVNLGTNMGDDVIYSGTLGAAIEGRHSKYGSVAISIASRKPKYFHDIDDKLSYIVDYIFKNLIKHKSIININIPDLPLSKIKGIKITKQGKREISKRAPLALKNNKSFYNIGKVGRALISPGCDFDAVRKGFISITPLTIDMTDSITYKKIK